MKFKWIAIMASVCMITAVAASAVTAFLLTSGVIGRWRPQATDTSGETSGTGQTSGSSQISGAAALSPTSKPSPTQKPTPVPTIPAKPSATPKPTPTPDPSTHSALEDLYLWQVHDLLENIYEDISPSVAGIQIEVSSSDSATRLTNEGSGIVITAAGDIALNAGLLSIAIDKQGKILPNAKIMVRISGVTGSFPASLVSRDLMTGLAVLHINPGENKLTPARFAEKANLKIGQMILTVGYPDDVFNSGCMTSGFISGLYYPVILEDGTTMQMIQTTAPISASCIGGPLLNLEGQVVGLTCSAPGQNAGDPMSYALPGDETIRICMDLIEKGYVSGRSWLGINVSLEDRFIELQKLYNLPDGRMISAIVKGSPAASVDLRIGDVITRINDTAVSPSMDLVRFMQSQPVGTLVVIRIYRRSDGKYHDIAGLPAGVHRLIWICGKKRRRRSGCCGSGIRGRTARSRPKTPGA